MILNAFLLLGQRCIPMSIIQNNNDLLIHFWQKKKNVSFLKVLNVKFIAEQVKIKKTSQDYFTLNKKIKQTKQTIMCLLLNLRIFGPLGTEIRHH